MAKGASSFDIDKFLNDNKKSSNNNNKEVKPFDIDAFLDKEIKKKTQAEPISEDFTPVQPQEPLNLSKEQKDISVNPFVKAVSKNPNQIDVVNPTKNSVEQTIEQYEGDNLVDSQKLNDLTNYLKSPDLQDITKWNLDKEKEKEIKEEVLNNFDYLDTLPKEQAESEIKNKVWEIYKSNTLANAAVQEYNILKDFKTTLNTEVTEPTDEYLNLFTNIIEQTNKQKFGVETNIEEVEARQQRKNKIYSDYANYLKETNPDAYIEYQDGLLTKDNKKSANFYNSAISHQYKLINAKAATGALDKETYDAQVEELAQEQKEALMYFPETKKEIDETERRKAENDKRYNQFKQTLEDPNASVIDKAIASHGIGYYQVIQPAISAATKFGAGIISTIGRAAALSESLKPEEISFEDEINGLVDDFSDYIETTSERLMPSQLQGGLFEDGEFKGEKLMPKVTETMTEMVLLISTGGVVGSGLKAAGTSALAAERAGLMATSFFRTYNDYYEEASDMVGMSEKDKTLFALTSATTTSALELINPQRYLTGVKGVSSFSPKKALDDIAKGISIPQAIKQNAKISGKEIVFENLQELSQEVGDKVNKYVFNEVVGTTFDTEISRDELAEIAVLTSIVSGGASSIQFKGRNTIKVETFEWARNNKDLFERATESETNLKAVGKENVEQAKKDVEEYTKIYEAMPNKYSDSQKAYLSSKQLDLQKLKERQKSLDALEPQIVAEEKEKVEGAIQEAEKEITSIINKGNYVLTENGEEKNLSLEEINNLAEDEEFIAKVAEGEVDLSVSDNPELSQKIQDKVVEYNAVKAIDQSLQDDSVEQTKTQTDETTETETVQEIGQDKLETTDTTGDAKTDVELPKSTSEDTGSTQDSKRTVKTTAAQAKYGLGKRGATGKVPLDKRQPKDPDIRKASDLNIDNNDVSGYVRRYFAVNGFKILTKEISNLFKGSKTEVSSRINMRRTPQKGGKTIDELVHEIWEAMPNSYKDGIDDYYVKQEIEKIIIDNPTRVEVAQELNSKYGVDEPMYTEKDGEFFNESGEQVWETEYGWLTESDIAELEAIRERAEKYKDIDEETYAEALDITFKLTEEEINQINEADDAFIEDKINQLEQEQPKTPKQTAKEKLDKAREDFRKSGGLSTGGLQNLEQFVNLVAAYVEYGITSVKEILQNIQASNMNTKGVNESKVEEALKILEARDNSLEVVKNALNDVNTSTNQALEQGYDDFVEKSGVKLSKAKYKEWVATEITRETEKKRIKRTEQEVEELFEGEEKKKTDQKQKDIKLSKIKTEADIKKAQTKLRDYAKKILPNTRFVRTEMIGVMTSIKNIKTDKNAESAKQRIDEIADKAKMRSKIASLSNFRRRGIRNLRTKLGHLYSPANAILRAKTIPEELFDKYEQVVKMLGENAKVLTIDADLVNELYEDMQVHFAVNESLDLTKDVMTEQEKENKAIRDAIKEKLKVEEQIEIFKKTAAEVKKQLISKDIDLGNKDLNKTAIQFTNLPQDYLASLSSKELTNINKELINLSNNFISNGFIPNRVLDYKGWDKAQKTLDAKNVLGRKGTLEVFETPKDRALKDALKEVQEIEKQKISDNEKARKIEKIIDKRMKGRMSNHLSEIVKSVENQAFYTNTQSLFTKAYEASNMNTKRDESIFSGLLTNSIKSLVGSVNLRTGRTTEATFEISTKLSYILRELEHQANPENKTTPPLKDIFDKQMEDAKGDNKLELSEKDFEIMQKVYDSMVKYEKDGVIDVDAFINKELTPQERKLVEYVRETYKKYSEKYTYIAQVSGKTPILTNEYSHRSSRRQEVVDELNPEQLWDSIANGSFNAGSLEERIGGTPLITPFAINDFVSYINEMNTVYYMTPVLKEFNAVIKHLKANGNKTTNIIAKTTAKNQKLNLMLTFKRNQVVSNNWHNFLKIAIRNVAIKTLISPIRFAQEISNLTVGIIKSPKIIANRKAIKELSRNKAYEKIIQDYGSSQGEKLLKLSKGVYSVDFKDTDIAKTVRKGANGTDVSWGDATIEAFKNNMAREFGEKASTIYYKIVDVALPSTHKAEFLTSFKDATGKDFDANKFLNDEVYRAENEENVRQALAEADVETSDLYNTASQLESKIKTKGLDVFDIRNIMSNFMQSFSFNEWAVIRKSLGSIIGGGTSKRGNASVKLAAIMTRMVIYDVIGMYIANMIYRPDEEEEEFTKIMQKSGLNSLSLFLYGNLPGYAKWFINVGVNTAYGYYKELVENEKFVPSKDNLLYGNKLSRATDVFRLFGAFGSVMQTGVAMTDKTFTLMEKMLEGEEITQEDLIELRVYSAYYEGLATTLGLPFLKDVKALESYLIKKQAKSSGGYTIKQKGSKKKKVVKE